jgi:hypothetical protein
MITRKFHSLAAPVLALVLLFNTVPMPGCTTADLLGASADVVSYARDTVEGLKLVLPPDHPYVKAAARWVTQADDFRQKLAAAITDDDKVRLLPVLSALVKVFREEILPRLNLSTEVAAAIAGIDVALRIIARHFEKKAREVQAEVKSGSDEATAMDEAAPDAAADVQALSDYLALPELKKPKRAKP